MNKFQIIIMCMLLFTANSLLAVTSSEKPKRPPKDKPASTMIQGQEILTGNINEPLALDMLKAYRKLKTYHAVWEMVPPANLKDFKQKIQIETAYDKKTGSCLYKMNLFEQKDEKWQPMPLDKMGGTFLVVYEPNTLNVAFKMGAEPDTKEVKFDDKKKFTFRDFRRSIMPFQPFDLPLMASEMPFHELLQANPNDAKETTHKTDKPKVRTLELFPEGGPTETAARLAIDIDKLLINRFCYFKPQDNKVNIGMKRVSLTINKPLPSDIFDFDKQLATFKMAKKSQKQASSAK